MELTENTIGSYRTFTRKAKSNRSDTLMFIWTLALVCLLLVGIGFIAGSLITSNVDNWASVTTAE